MTGSTTFIISPKVLDNSTLGNGKTPMSIDFKTVELDTPSQHKVHNLDKNYCYSPYILPISHYVNGLNMPLVSMCLEVNDSHFQWLSFIFPFFSYPSILSPSLFYTIITTRDGTRIKRGGVGEQ